MTRAEVVRLTQYGLTFRVQYWEPLILQYVNVGGYFDKSEAHEKAEYIRSLWIEENQRYRQENESIGGLK